MWLLSDEKTQGNVRSISYLSLKAQSEYDCAEERSRLLASTWFSGNMASGKVVFSSSDQDEWAPVEPVSLGRQLRKFACDKK
jgi:surface-adhesin protein E